MLAILAIVPLVAAALLALPLHDRRLSGYLAFLASIISMLLVFYLVWSNPGPQSLTWFSVSGFAFTVGTALQPLNELALIAVAVVTPLVVMYSLGSMRVPSEQGRFYFGMCLLSASMMLFSISSNFITLLIGWELLSLTGYLLVGFGYSSENAQNSARKAVTITLIGDVLMFAAMLLFWNSYGTLSFAALLQGRSSPAAAAALALVMVAALTKSAQFPFHEWLPDAADGPAASSALLLSSTAAKSGVLLLAVMLPMFAEYGMLWVLVAVGSVTALLGASNAIAENGMKRLLAYSTIEFLGLMVLALGLDVLAVAMMLFIVQSLCTVLLFVCAGSIESTDDNEDDLYRLHGPPVRTFTFAVSLIGVASAAGIFPLGAFFAASSMGVAAQSSLLAYAVLVIAGFAGSVCMFKWLLVPMRQGAYEATNGTYPSPSLPVFSSLYFSSVLVLMLPFAYYFLPRALGGVSGTGPQPALLVNAVIESAAALSGLALSYFLYRKARPYNMKAHPRLYTVMYNGVIVNVFYRSVAAFANALSRFVCAFDHGLGLFISGAAVTTERSGSALRLMVDGRTDVYVSLLVVGAILVMLLFMVW